MGQVSSIIRSLTVEYAAPETLHPAVSQLAV
jgi:hypothetical protein